jgi:redox-sensing transcriptional repressor
MFPVVVGSVADSEGVRFVNSKDVENPRIPDAVVRRLPKYLTCSQRLRQAGVAWVSSPKLAEALGLTSSTVRQDLSHIDFSGISKRGYSTVGLETCLAVTLGADHEICCVVVGAGNLGRALAQHEEFPRQGFKICGVFDSSPAVVGKKCGKLLVQGMGDLPGVVCGQDVDIGIVAVPHVAAQQVADHLIVAGVSGLLNLTTAHIIVPKKVSLVDARFLASLRELAYAVKVNEPRFPV